MQRETNNLEYKSEVNKGFLKTVSAYANFGAGRIVFGVDDDGSVTGLADPRQACLDIENRINDSVVPRPSFILRVREDGATVELAVEEGLDKPYLYGGKAYRRSDSASIEVDKVELERLILEGRNLSYDALPSRIGDLSFGELGDKLSEALGIGSLTDDILRTLGLLDGDAPTNAAAILADRNAFPGVDMARFGADEDTILDRESVEHVSALSLFDAAVAFYERYCTYEVIDGAERAKVERVPRQAFREAVANAIAHRTWDVPAPIRISIANDGVEVVSPGGLAPGMTSAAYLEGRYSLLRNPILAECLFRVGIIEKFGTGVRRIRRAYEGLGLHPRFDIGDGFISVFLPFIDGRSALEDDERLVFNAIPENRLVSRSAVSEVTGIEKTKAVRVLKSLVEKGYLRAEGEGRGRKYARSI